MELKMENVSKSFQSTNAVNNVSCVMKEGVYGLLGINGSGKTTMMSNALHPSFSYRREKSRQLIMAKDIFLWHAESIENFSGVAPGVWILSRLYSVGLSSVYQFS